MVPLILYPLLMLSALITACLCLRLYASVRRYQPPAEWEAPNDPPSVSVCIPARNEMHAMTKCLERVLASDYKKLEVVVFDDSSVDNTSIIIRSYAHAGVRFVAGTGLPEGWLGKNYALDVLAREASGTYVMFMDVDTVIAPTTVSRLVAYMISEAAEMASVIPERQDGWRLSVLFGHLRYFWELTVKGERSPATSSALWIVNRHTLLRDLGGLQPLRSTVAPESAVASTLGPTGYRCLIAGNGLEVGYEKKWISQAETGRRLLYPKTGGTPAGAALAVCGLMLLNLPLIVLVYGLLFRLAALQLVAALVLVFGMGMYGFYAKHLWRHAWWAGLFLWPLVVMQELLLLFVSIIGYTRHTITWKGRPVSPSPSLRQTQQ